MRPPAGLPTPAAHGPASLAQAKYAAELGRPAPEVSLDTAHWLPPPPKEGRHTHDDEFQSW